MQKCLHNNDRVCISAEKLEFSNISCIRPTVFELWLSKPNKKLQLDKTLDILFMSPDIYD